MTMSQDTAKKIENIEGKTWAINNKQIVLIIIALGSAFFSAGSYWTNTTNSTDTRFNRIENMLTLLNLKDSLRIQSINQTIDRNHDEASKKFDVIEKRLSLTKSKPITKYITTAANQLIKGYTQTKVNGLIVWQPVY